MHRSHPTVHLWRISRTIPSALAQLFAIPAPVLKEREQQLRGACTACLLKLSAYCELFVTELAALRERERSEMAEYEIDILRGIHKEIKQVLLTPPTTCNHSTPHHLTSLPRRSARERWRNALPTRRTFARWLSRT